MVSPIYESIKLQAYYPRENTCTVYALAAITGDRWDDADAAIQFVTGRVAGEPNNSIRWPDYFSVIHALGLSLRLVINPKIKTAITAERELAKLGGKYLLAMSNGGHVAAVVDGELADWSRGSRTRVDWVWQVVADGKGTIQVPDRWLNHFTRHKVKTGYAVNTPLGKQATISIEG